MRSCLQITGKNICGRCTSSKELRRRFISVSIKTDVTTSDRKKCHDATLPSAIMSVRLCGICRAIKPRGWYSRVSEFRSLWEVNSAIEGSAHTQCVGTLSVRPKTVLAIPADLKTRKNDDIDSGREHPRQMGQKRNENSLYGRMVPGKPHPECSRGPCDKRYQFQRLRETQ